MLGEPLLLLVRVKGGYALTCIWGRIEIESTRRDRECVLIKTGSALDIVSRLTFFWKISSARNTLLKS